jgi:tetratricopeptide (TPR) repeat protein
MPRERASWIEVKSEQFRVVSELDADTTRAMVRELELLESVAVRLAGTRPAPPRVPTTIAIFRDSASYRRFADPDTNGVFSAGPRENVALVDGTARAGGVGVLMHEYTHFLVHNAAPFSYPTWYDEGIAELVRGTRLGEDHVAVGLPLENRRLTVLQSRMFPLRRLLRENPTELDELESALFYAKSWHFVRFVRLGGKLGLRDRSADLNAYFARLNAGDDRDTAFRSAFHASYTALESEFEDYLRQGFAEGARLPRTGFTQRVERAVRVLDEGEVGRVLGTVALRVHRFAQAERQFRAALTAAPDDARASFGLAHALRAQGRARESEALYARALELDPGSLLGQVDYAQHLLARVDAGDPARAALLERAREHLRRAIALDPTLPEPHAELAASELLVAGGDVERGLAEATRAHELLRANSRVTYLLAVAHYRTGRFDEARRLLAVTRAQRHERAPELDALAARIDEAAADEHVAANAKPPAQAEGEHAQSQPTDDAPALDAHR